ncbi:uncharacterized protein DNG_04629 [Cephalotrichum gorgonifer]|uniref:Uncharacterized protein n=1 Tax=Cephalotrichum gorgonifer TaxID=2041049 RepID=A0AAE8MWF8_9PEZI|nr:uncharacterized protein DNG_04629 [Cephalotrichum gorgonifer]
MEFHMSYPVLRDVNRQAIAPCRHYGDLHRPEKTSDLSFLSPTESPAGSNGKLELLHEAQASCVVAGYSKEIWDVYSLVDKSLEHDCNENNNSLLHYDYTTANWASDTTEMDIADCKQQSAVFDGDADVEIGPRKHDEGDEFDAVTMGRELADTPHTDPKHYFLLVLKVRAENAENEWTNTTGRLKRAIKEYLESPSVTLLQQTRGTESAQSHTECLERSEKWVSKTISLIGDLAGSLAGNIHAWDRFETQHGDHSNGSLQEMQLARQFNEISNIFEELRRIQGELKDLEGKCKRFQDEIKGMVMVRGDRASVMQQWTVTLKDDGDG